MKFLHLASALTAIAALSTPAFADEVAEAAAKGKAKYILCGACHGLDGSGQPAPGMQMAANFKDSKILKLSLIHI